MFTRKSIVNCILALGFFSTLYAQNPKISIALFTPRLEDDMFWGQFSQFMAEAVRDLGMDMQVFYAGGNHLTMQNQVKQAVSGEKKFDVLVVPNFKKTGGAIVQIAEDAQVPIFIVNSTIRNFGKPRERFTYWIGEMVPDDQQAGYAIARLLLDKGKS